MSMSKKRQADYYKQWYAKNKFRRSQWSRQYRERNVEKIKAARKRYRQSMTVEDKLKQNARGRRYYQENKAKVIARTIRYRKMNKPWLKAYISGWNKAHRPILNAKRRAKYNSNPNFRIGLTCRNRLVQFLRWKGVFKPAPTLALIGIPDFEFLKNHLEKQFKPGMSWDNYGRDGWHIDHIIPLASFDLHDNEQLLKAFHFTNLQPLWAAENYTKSDNLPDAGSNHPKEVTDVISG